MIGPRWEVCTPCTNVSSQGEYQSGWFRLIIWDRKDVEESTTMSIKAILILHLPRVLCFFFLCVYVCVYTHVQTHTIHSLLFFTLCPKSRGEESHKSVSSRKWGQLGSILESICYSSQPASLKIMYMNISERCLTLGKYSIRGSITVSSSKM